MRPVPEPIPASQQNTIRSQGLDVTWRLLSESRRSNAESGESEECAREPGRERRLFPWMAWLIPETGIPVSDAFSCQRRGERMEFRAACSMQPYGGLAGVHSCSLALQFAAVAAIWSSTASSTVCHTASDRTCSKTTAQTALQLSMLSCTDVECK